jgi:hypothetical protein
MLDGVLSLVFEVLLNAVFELGAEAGFRALAAPFLERPHPALAVLGYAAYGAGVGALSSVVLTEFVIRDPTLAAVNLAMSPVFAGLTMMGLGALRARRGQTLIRLDSFFYGWLFAAAFVLTRLAMLSP